MSAVTTATEAHPWRPTAAAGPRAAAPSLQPARSAAGQTPPVASSWSPHGPQDRHGHEQQRRCNDDMKGPLPYELVGSVCGRRLSRSSGCCLIPQPCIAAWQGQAMTHMGAAHAGTTGIKGAMSVGKRYAIPARGGTGLITGWWLRRELKQTRV